MRHVDDEVLELGHLEQVGRAAEVVDLAVLRMLLHERLARVALQQPVDRLRHHQVVVAADLDPGVLLVRHDQERAIRLPLRRLVVFGLRRQELLALQLAADAVDDAEDVDAHRLGRRRRR